MNPVRTVIFDIDGTLVDSFDNCRVFEEAFHQYYPHRRVPREAFLRSHALSMHGSMDAVGIPEEERPAFADFWLAYHQRLDITHPLFEGVEALVQALHGAGYTLGVNTARTRAGMQDIWARNQKAVFRHFSWAHCMYDELAGRPKPAPDSLRRLLHIHGLAPQEMLFIGDSDMDYLCAKGAGVPFFWAGWGWHIRPENAHQGTVLRHPMELMRVL